MDDGQLARLPWWLRPLDGGPTWGSLDSYPRRFGVTRYRLVVFPPGISPEERRLLRLWRSWPVWGALLWLVAEISLTDTTTPWAALSVSTTLYLGTGAVTLALAGSSRTRVRTMYAVLMDGRNDALTVAALTELRTLACILYNADSLRDQGKLSAIGHEAACWRVYDRMAPELLNAHPSGGASPERPGTTK